MTNIILCSDSFKGTLSSSDIANIGKELVNNNKIEESYCQYGDSFIGLVR